MPDPRVYVGWVVVVVLLWYHYNTVLQMDVHNFQYYEQKFIEEVKRMQEYSMEGATTQNVSVEYSVSTITPENYQDQCKPRNKIVFLKTHKTGSETLAGIFRKWAMMNNISTLYSDTPGGHLYHKQEVVAAVAENQYYDPVNDKIDFLGTSMPGAHYELITNHFTWNKTFIDKWTNPDERFTLSILRDPTTLLESSWKYYYVVLKNPKAGWRQMSGDGFQTQQLYQLLENPNTFYEDVLKMKQNGYRHVLRTQLASFGYGEKVYERNLDREVIQGWINEIERDFDLILIMEYFDYSLALLALELCWPLDQLANLKSNVGRSVKIEKKMYHEELIRVINYPDYMLYEHFNKTFWERVNKIGLETVDKMASKIREASKVLEDECVWRYRPIRLWNGKYGEEAVIKPGKEDNITCQTSTLWGNRQVKMAMKYQRAQMELENWNDPS